jgi:F0F1-type ATP synthase membrane subunit b/b'
MKILPVLVLPLAGCGDGSRTADVVEAATRGAAEMGQQLAEKAAQLADMTPAEAKAKLQGVLDAAARELKEIKDSETAQIVIAHIEQAFDTLVELAKKLGEKLDLAGMKASVTEMVERFKADPRVQHAVESLKTKVDTLTKG